MTSPFSRRSKRGVTTMVALVLVMGAMLQIKSTSTALHRRTSHTIAPAPVSPPENPLTGNNDQDKLDDSIEAAPYLSACVFYMDDNHRLAEWLAYHYYTMNLRHVIMSIDFKSLTDPPQDILDQWVSKGLLETAEIWHQRDYMIPDWYEKDLNDVKNNIPLHEGWFGNTQNDFYRQCAKEHRARNRTWVSFHDTDEFWLLNPDKVPDALLRMSQPGSVLSYIVDGQADASKGTNTAMLDTAKADGTSETSAATMAPTGLPTRYHGPCVTTHRLLFLPIDSQPLQRSRQVPSWINPLSFETLRWRYHGDEHTDDNGKSLVDVSRVNSSDLDDPANFVSPHKVMIQCPNTWFDEDSYL
jgi:hypothetical protein